MTSTMVLQGRAVSDADTGLIRELLAEHPEWGRSRLSQELCRRWEWRNAQGRPKDMAARTLLLKLERAGHIRLPSRQRPSSNQFRNRRAPGVPPGPGQPRVGTRCHAVAAARPHRSRNGAAVSFTRPRLARITPPALRLTRPGSRRLAGYGADQPHHLPAAGTRRRPGRPGWPTRQSRPDHSDGGQVTA